MVPEERRTAKDSIREITAKVLRELDNNWEQNKASFTDKPTLENQVASLGVRLDPHTTIPSDGGSPGTTSLTPLSPEQGEEQFGRVKKDVPGSDVQYLEAGTDCGDLQEDFVFTNLDQNDYNAICGYFSRTRQAQ